MPDLLIRGLEAELKRRIEERAQRDNISLSEEAKRLIQKGLIEPRDDRLIGTALASLVPTEDRGDDLVFERADMARNPPDFE